MFNKKGGVAAEEIRGIMVFMIGMVVIMLIFYGCGISKVKTEYEEFVFSKDEIEAHKALNFFLEMPVDDGKKMSDIIIWSSLNDDYEELGNLVENYFSQKPYKYWTLRLYEDYSSYNSAIRVFTNYDYDGLLDYSIMGGHSEAYIISMENNLELALTLSITID
jgi:hypothetical protein